ncbi:Energy-coupling factor transporter ATP-binding protein EcfA2 [Halanaeroarchaeum sp. HSR-CO]|uniref:energy-coupling factor ABC transporter ATP-binding protein n=1 Tax=Halanaeroarchaeum sp. HSR-CO TaxID=2866382 RepID=UPI00217E5EA9|nr:ABC transporter ATP-binding protein [Halanaeroarchaeum sp. HSR-CO]UWG46820.1 Energy-coupling factor transporter ATP-binding protein EcfA2 [Halanaeroarchaeum sp. HSR-CO]
MSLLATDALSVRTTTGAVLLDGVDLSVERDEMVVVAGRSGSGKTTLTKAIGGLLDSRPNIETAGTVSGPENVGFLFQNPRTQLVRRSVRHDVAFDLENQGVPRDEMERRIEQWAERLDATPFLDREVDALSRGETAVVALLGALVTEPDLVVLDEPLAPLDDRNRRLVLDAIETLRDHGSTLLVTEHDLRDVLPLADRVLVLEEGRVTSGGSPSTQLARLADLGITLPFATRVGLERGQSPERLPLSTVSARDR